MTLEIITSDSLLPARHGFFTRKGGASSGVFSGLNCGPGSSDQSEAVAINRARVAAAMQVDPDHLVTLHQVHSADVVVLSEPIPAGSIKADAMVTKTPGIALGVQSADCQPVLFLDRDAGVIGAAHAGWKGALAGVLGVTVDAMIGIGAVRENISAVIGPTISQTAYEVGPEFREQVLSDNPANSEHFIAGDGDRYQFDLPGFGLQQLRGAGIGSAEWTGHCTYGDADLFFSYRRGVHQGQVDYGRLISTIRL